MDGYKITVTVTDRKEILKFARFLERRRLHPDEPLFVTYAEFYGEVVYDEDEEKNGAGMSRPPVVLAAIERGEHK